MWIWGAGVTSGGLGGILWRLRDSGGVMGGLERGIGLWGYLLCFIDYFIMFGFWVLLVFFWFFLLDFSFGL